MRNYIIKRLLLLVPIILIVAVIGNMATESEVARLEQSLGLDQPLIMRFFRWLANITKGDFGESLYLNAPVSEVLFERLRPTLFIAVMAEVMGITSGLLLGILAAVNHVNLGWFPVSGYEPFTEAGFGSFRYLILPAVTLAFMQAGLIARMTRSAMLDTLKQDYIRTAKSKGLSRKMIVFKHALKNSMLPVITVIGHNFAVLLGGTWIVETIFVIPGTGFMAINAIMRRDIPVIQASIIFVAVIYVIINLFVDLSYAFLNPKIRYH
jgi:peptide/nickel transport system permease protein